MICHVKSKGVYAVSCTIKDIRILAMLLSHAKSHYEVNAPEYNALKTSVNLLRKAKEDNTSGNKILSDPSENAFIESVSKEGSTFVITMKKKPLRTFVPMINRAVNGFGLWEWEFQTITGYHRHEMRNVFNQLHLCAVMTDADMSDEFDLYEACEARPNSDDLS